MSADLEDQQLQSATSTHVEVALPLNLVELEAIIERELPIQKSTVDALIKIAQHPALSNFQYVGNLPPSWGTLYELSQREIADVVGVSHTTVDRDLAGPLVPDEPGREPLEDTSPGTDVPLEPANTDRAQYLPPSWGTLGVSDQTVHRDLEAVSNHFDTDMPDRVAGTDGKSYPASAVKTTRIAGAPDGEP